MELRHLRYFVAVAEEQNVTRAAARLHVSQPPLTRQIHDLEHELGFPLFARTGKSLHLTAAGRTFLDESRTVLARLEGAIAAARAVANGAGAELQVGYAPSPTAGLLGGTLQAFEEAQPGTRVILHDQTTPEMLAGLRKRELHAALLMQPPKTALGTLRFEPLRTYPIGLAVWRDHPLARRRTVSLADLTQHPLVVLAAREYPDYHAFIARIAGRFLKRFQLSVECDSGMSMIAAIEARRGVAISSLALADVAGRRLTFLPLKPAPAPAVVGIAYRPDERSPLIQAFVAAARSQAPG